MGKGKDTETDLEGKNRERLEEKSRETDFNN